MDCLGCWEAELIRQTFDSAGPESKSHDNCAWNSGTTSLHGHSGGAVNRTTVLVA